VPGTKLRLLGRGFGRMSQVLGGLVTIRRWTADQKRVARWVLFGAAAATMLMMRDISTLLGSIESAGERSYDAGVLTGPKLFFWDTNEFREAVRIWRGANTEQFDVVRLIRWHVGLDIFPFIPAYAALLGLAIRRVGASRVFATTLGVALVVVDEIETGITAFALVGTDLEIEDWYLLRPDLKIAGFVFGTIKFFSLMKWLVLVIGLVTIVVLWPKRIKDASNLGTGFVEARKDSMSGLDQLPAVSVSGLTFLVAVLGAIVALPANGPLEQLPDVLRNHIADGDLGQWALSTAGLGLFVAAVILAGLVSTAPGGQSSSHRTISDGKVVMGAVILSLALFSLGCAIDGHPNAPALAPVLIVVGLTIAARLAKVSRRGMRVEKETAKECALSSGAKPPTTPSDPLPGRLPGWGERAALWVAGLASAVVVIAGLGLVRAAFSPFVLGAADGRFPWSRATVLGCAGALGGGVIQWGLSRRFLRTRRRSVAMVMLVLIAAIVVGPTVWLMVSPLAGHHWGSTGVVGVGFAFWALVVGVLTWASRTRAHWEAPHTLMSQVRTPWLTLLVATWVLASVLNTRGGYHDARVDDAFGPTQPTYKNLQEAFETWRVSQAVDCGESDAEGVPLVLVAAPGGGIRAAYWTSAALDELFVHECTARLFAISGVSGGSLGATAWIAARAEEEPAAPVVAKMSNDRALPAALAALLFRDLPQPLLGVTTGWADRAAILEDGWIESTKVFGSVIQPQAWAEAARPSNKSTLPYVPVLTLNGSSVNDGCRVIVSNVGLLPGVTGQDCQVSPEGDTPTGPVSGSIDAFVGLYERDAADHNCDQRQAGMRSTTAALLSARFPVISPSGALLRCLGSGVETTTYSVDGGYYENSGLLTLLQMWGEIEDSVREHNQAVSATNKDPLGNTEIEPWIVVIDNHYRSHIRRASAGHPLEILAVLTAYQQEVLTQTMLEQIASFEMSNIRELCSADNKSEGNLWAGPRPATDEGVECESATLSRSGFVRIAPNVEPAVSAPLGWVLSRTSRTNLRRQLDMQMSSDDDSPL
jgi:hypothetical protein